MRNIRANPWQWVVGSAGVLVFLGFVALCDGFMHSTYWDFKAEKRELSVPGSFKPEIRPYFKSGSSVGLRCVVPFLYSHEWSTDSDPAILIDIPATAR